MAKTTTNTSFRPGSGSFRDFERNNADVGRGELLKVPLSRIQVRENFNPRNLLKPETQAKIQEIKDAYKEGIFVPAILVRLESNEAVSIVDGECRFTSAKLADAELRAEGKPGIATLMCVPFKGDDFECKMMTVAANKGEQLTVLELSRLVRDAIDTLNIPKVHIAKRLSWSASYIDKLELISKLPQEIKDMIQADTISVDVAMDFNKRHGEAAPAMLASMAALADGVKITTAKAKALEAQVKKTAAADTGSDGEGDGDGSDAPAPAPAAPKANAKKVLAAATTLVYALPEIEQDVDEIKDTKTYTLKVTGAALKAIIALQGEFPDEIDIDADPEPEPASSPAQAPWPFPTRDQQAA